MGIYVFTWEVLRKYLVEDEADRESQNDFGKNIIPKMLFDGQKMIAYEFNDYWKDVGTISSLWEANMDILNPVSGLNPSDDGRVIRVPVPPLTEERRREIVKTASGKVEEAKIQLRNIREDARKDIKAAELAEDAKKRAEKAIDDMIRDFNTSIDKLFAEKEAEIMKI